MTANDWLAAIAQVRANDVETPAKGFVTMKELCRVLNVKRSRCRDMVHGLVAAGLAEKRTYRIQCEGKVAPVPHYRLTGGSKTQP